MQQRDYCFVPLLRLSDYGTVEEIIFLTPEHISGDLCAYSALFDHGLASKSDQRFASIRSTGNLTFS
ncbi:hypothetical protein FCY53_25950, partial [Escherichia coli]|nr:hypothetical protein [Escherichia coli]